MTALCHCMDCQKWSGSAFSSNVAVPTAQFSVTKGLPRNPETGPELEFLAKNIVFSFVVVSECSLRYVNSVN